ncbi:MAG: tetratricopeptide repeat protein [Candidatus Scalinduaceae bacterium]
MTILKKSCISLFLFLNLSFIAITSEGKNDEFEQAKQHLKDGIRTYDEELLQDAKEVFIQLANKNPSDYVYPYYAALTYLSLCDLKNFEMVKSSIRAKKKALKKERIALAGEGIVYVDKSIKLNDNYSESHRVKGALISNRISGMISGIHYGNMAEDEINIALKIEPNNALAKIEVAREYINKPGLLGGNVKKGIEILEKILKDNPEIEKGYVSLGIAYKEIGEKEKAMNTFKRVLEINPDNLEAKFFLDQLMLLQ